MYFEINFFPRPDRPKQCPEWAIVDLQGSLETRQPVPLGGEVCRRPTFHETGTNQL